MPYPIRQIIFVNRNKHVVKIIRSDIVCTDYCIKRGCAKCQGQVGHEQSICRWMKFVVWQRKGRVQLKLVERWDAVRSWSWTVWSSMGYRNVRNAAVQEQAIRRGREGSILMMTVMSLFILRIIHSQ